ncbi:MAG TPA: citrate synthase [Bryobacteraceae bacterium]|nr:citrate synthase [Bryobacteraceae bacterium]
MAEDTLTVIDNRTSISYTIPVEHGAIRTTDLRQLKTGPDDFGLMSYDPAFMNTASCQSRITYIDGDKGILLYRGYPIEQLAERCTYLETADLLLTGELPTPQRLREFETNVARHSGLKENVKRLMEGFRYDAHPMGILVSAIASLTTLYPEGGHIHDPAIRERQIWRLLAKIPIIAAYIYRLYQGYAYVPPDPDLSYTENFMSMLWKKSEAKFRPNPVMTHALEVLYILHADHEQNCSTAAMRVVGSAYTDPYLTTAAAAAALSGPLHGGANEEVLRMLDQIGSKEHIPEFIKRVKAGECRLMGFGHRVYKNYDPRARIIRQIANEVFEVTGRNPRIDIAIELERIALEDDYFVKRKLYPNVDFYSGIIYQAMGFRPEMFTVLFGIARTAGWLAQWQEMITDKEQKIARPRQLYLGQPHRELAPAAHSAAEYPWTARR